MRHYLRKTGVFIIPIRMFTCFAGQCKESDINYSTVTDLAKFRG